MRVSNGAALRAPFPWFGGKSRAAPILWPRLGPVPNYVEPFGGSLAPLLGRPDEPGLETVNDIDCYVANFWRALAHDPEQVAYWCDWPVNEADLHARHRWLVHSTRKRRRKIKASPDYYDAKVAGWWVYGQCLWIGSDWCRAAGQHNKLPSIGRGGERGVASRRWNSGGRGGGSGVHAPSLGEDDGLDHYLRALAVRLRRVRVCCGDWRRVLQPSVTTYNGITGVVLDPPYDDELRDAGLYAHDDGDISGPVREWAIENGDNPEFRIALCGYQGEHEMPETWQRVAWKAHGGYSKTEQGQANRELERIWFSPHCLRPGDRLPFEA